MLTASFLPLEKVFSSISAVLNFYDPDHNFNSIFSVFRYREICVYLKCLVASSFINLSSSSSQYCQQFQFEVKVSYRKDEVTRVSQDASPISHTDVIVCRGVVMVVTSANQR